MRGRELKRRVEKVLEQVGLAERAKERVQTYSGGMKRRINIGVGLLHRPRLLFMDEPVAAAIIVPAGFTASIIPTSLDATTMANDGNNAPAIEVYANPGRPVSSGVVQAIVEEFVKRVETGRIAGQVTIIRLLESELISLGSVLRTGWEMGQRLADEPEGLQLISVRRSAVGAAEDDFNPMAILAPSMALLFLMYTVTLGGRSILAERQGGTLARLLATPTPAGQVLVGKIVGTYLLGAAQLAILLGVSSLLYNLRWGDPLGLLLLILAAAAAATGWGLLVAAIAQTPSQVSNIGTALMLLFGLLGGSFFGNSWVGPLAVLGKITPNAWGLDGFWILARGGGAADLLPIMASLLLMAALLIALSTLIFNRKGVLQR